MRNVYSVLCYCWVSNNLRHVSGKVHNKTTTHYTYSLLGRTVSCNVYTYIVYTYKYICIKNVTLILGITRHTFPRKTCTHSIQQTPSNHTQLVHRMLSCHTALSCSFVTCVIKGSISLTVLYYPALLIPGYYLLPGVMQDTIPHFLIGMPPYLHILNTTKHCPRILLYTLCFAVYVLLRFFLFVVFEYSFRVCI